MLTKLPYYCAAKRHHNSNSTHMKVNYVFFTSYAKTNKNRIFDYTSCITPKRATILRGSSPRHCARATQLPSKKYRSVGKPLATLCPICPARDSNLRPPAPETNALPLDRLAGTPQRLKKIFRSVCCNSQTVE